MPVLIQSLLEDTTSKIVGLTLNYLLNRSHQGFIAYACFGCSLAEPSSLKCAYRHGIGHGVS
jgi:hypothetical protein